MERQGSREVCVLGQDGGESMLGHRKSSLPPPLVLVCCGRARPEDLRGGGARGQGAGCTVDASLKVVPGHIIRYWIVAEGWVS